MANHAKNVNVSKNVSKSNAAPAAIQTNAPAPKTEGEHFKVGDTVAIPPPPKATKVKGPELIETTLREFVKLGEKAGDILDSDTHALRTREAGKNAIWAGYMGLAIRCGTVESFGQYWDAAKREFVKPANAALYGSLPSSKKPGKFTVSRYLTETVSRIQGAMKLSISLLTADGSIRPQTELAKAVSEANTALAAAEVAKTDPNHELRVAIVAEIIEMGSIVRKGSHSVDVLNAIKAELQVCNDYLRKNSGKVALAA